MAADRSITGLPRYASDVADTLFAQRNQLLVALRDAHNEEGVCSCAGECVLVRPWARRALRDIDEPSRG